LIGSNKTKDSPSQEEVSTTTTTTRPTLTAHITPVTPSVVAQTADLIVEAAHRHL